MAAMKTPGVNVVGKNAVPDAVVEVATAVPAFIGYTEKAGGDVVCLNSGDGREACTITRN